MSEEKNCICVAVGDFDPSRLVLSEPRAKESKDGKFTWFVSDGFYKDDNEDLCKLYLTLPEQVSFVNAIYDNNLSDLEKYDPNNPETRNNIKNIEGFQISYPVTSIETMETPTQEESATINLLQSLWDLSKDRMGEFAKDEELDFPDVSRTSYFGAEAVKDFTKAMKPVFTYPMMKDKNNKKKWIEDTSKPKKMKAKFNAFGKGRKIKNHTVIYGPGDKPMSPFNLLNKSGKILPVFRWDGVYWGGHGKRSWGGSVTLRLSEGTFTPMKRGPPRRMAPRNTAPIDLLDDNDTLFPLPSGNEEGTLDVDGDSADPGNALANLKKSKTETKTTKRKPNRSTRGRRRGGRTHRPRDDVNRKSEDES